VMNIWIFNRYAHGPDLPGGTRHYDLGKELVRRGHQVTIFASSFQHYLQSEVGRTVKDGKCGHLFTS